MRARKLIVLFLSFTGLLFATWIAAAQQTRRIDDLALRNAGKTGEEWLTYGLTPGETRYSPLKQIDTSSVSRLGLAWAYDVGQGGGNQEATPLFWNGGLYGITNWSVVFAVDARTGKERWRWDPEVNQTAVRPKICCGVVNRGIAIYQGKIIAPVIDGRLEALDAETGKPVWEARVAYPQDNYTITMAPRIAKGKVIIGVSGSEFPVRGFFAAYDANTGQLVWRFYTIPGDQWQAAKGSHAGEQGRFLLCSRSRHWSVHFSSAFCASHMGKRHRSRNRAADCESRSALRSKQRNHHVGAFSEWRA